MPSFRTMERSRKMIFLKQYTWKDDLSNIWKDSGRSLLHLSNHRKDHLSIKLKICKKVTFPEQSNVVKTIFSYVGKIKKDDLSETIYLERRSFQHLERLRKFTSTSFQSPKRSPFLNKIMS